MADLSSSIPGGPESNPSSTLSADRKLALFQAVFDEIPDVVLLKDENGDFLLCNQTLARLYGTTPDEMIGKHDDDYGVPKEMADGFRANVKSIMASGRTEIVFEDSRDATTGELRHFKSIKRPFKDADGRNQILVIAHDITDVLHAQRQVAQSEFTLQQVMKATQDGVWDWHVPSGHLSHNDRWFSILGFEAGEIPDHLDAFTGQLHPDDRPKVWEQILRLLDGTDSHYASEHRMLRKDGSVIWVLDRGRVVERDPQGRAIRVVGGYSDITERKHGQVALEQALQLAQSATRAKSEFLATMSHELRTPLNGILGMAQLLRTPSLTGEQRIDYANVILRSGETLLALLNDILDLSRVEAGKFKLVESSFEPAALVVETLEAFRAAAALKGLNLSLEGAYMPRGSHIGDPLRLRQMLSNYLANAIKFTPRGSIAASVTEGADSHGRPFLEFAVTDTGVGFPADKQHLLFRPFSQLDSASTREYGGSGLGLSIVARLAELMGGQVGASSTPGVGSRFWFRVPAMPLARADLPQDSSSPATSQQVCAGSARVLVAEDNPVNREVLGLLLDSLGAQADFVHDGKAAVDAITGGSCYDLILMDVQMPVLDGLAGTQRVRTWETAQHKARECRSLP
ncbi:MAG: PAS domain S-box protein [Rubrivivax sp.]|nr:PAS domain S-box protein [Rubrivivax sp.]